jgi:hypothetical protein
MGDRESLPEMSPELASLVRDAVASDPRPDDLARLRARVAAVVGAGGGGGAGGGAGGGGGVGAAIGSGGRGGTGALAGRGARALLGRVAAVVAVVLGVAGVVWIASTRAPASTPRPTTPVPDPAAPIDELPSSVATTPPPAIDLPSRDARGQRELRPRARSAPALERSSDLAPSPSSDLAPSAEPITEPPPAPVDDAAAEALLIERARQALAAAPDRALALTAEHARRFARPALRVEAEVIAIEALARLGRRDQARARADALLAAEPRTAYRHRIQRALAR